MPAVVLDHRAVLDSGALGQAGDVLEDPVRRVVVGAERLPVAVPAGRQAKLTWLNPSLGTAAPISARPPTVAGGHGEPMNVGRRRRPAALSRSVAFHTETDSGGDGDGHPAGASAASDPSPVRP